MTEGVVVAAEPGADEAEFPVHPGLAGQVALALGSSQRGGQDSAPLLLVPVS